MARVLDLTTLVGAYGTRLLAELGHDVVRLEAPEGDALRRLGPHLGDEVTSESGAIHQFLNAGKKSVAIDLGTEDGRGRLLALAARSDCLVASLPLPVEEAELLAANPDLVLVRIDDGPPELCAYASSGLLSITGEPDSRPTMLGGHIPYAAVGVYVAISTASALFARQATGAGQIVDLSAEQCLAALAEQVWIEYSAAGEVLERRGSRGGVTALAGALPCSDGYWMVSVPPSPQGWQNFVELVPDPAFKDDSTMADEAMRRERKDEILDLVSGWSADKKRDEIVEAAQRLHIPAAPVLGPGDLTSDPQLLDRGFLRTIEHPAFGRMAFPGGAMASLRGSDVAVAPRLGQDNDAILAELGEASRDGARR